MVTPVPVTEALLAEVEQKATAATPGPWEADMPSFLKGEPSGYVFGPTKEMVADECSSCQGVRIRGVGAQLPMKANAAYIARLSPDTALALVQEIRRLNRRIDSLYKSFCEMERERDALIRQQEARDAT